MSHAPSATVPPWSQLLVDPADDRLAELTESLTALDGAADDSSDWPEHLWGTLFAHGVPRWSLPKSVGGEACERTRLLQPLCLAWSKEA